MLKCKNCGHEVKLPPKRSTGQNAFYWFYLEVIARETGDDPNSLHEVLKRELLPPQFVKALGKERKIPASTTDLDKADFTDYLDRICALTGVPIPSPEEAGYISNYQPIVTEYETKKLT